MMKKKNTRGLTLVEVMISSIIFLAVTLIILSSSIQFLRSEKNVYITSRMMKDARVVEGNLNSLAVTAVGFNVESRHGLTANSLAMTFPDGSVTRFELVSIDGSLYTVDDNYFVQWNGNPPGANPGSRAAIEAAGNILMENACAVLVPGEDPAAASPAYMPVFRQFPGVFAVEVRIRTGDNDPDPLAPCHGETGPGWQTYVMQTTLFPRNAT